MLELIESLGLKTIGDTLSNKHVKVETIGSIGAKPDNIMIVMEKPISEGVDRVLNEWQHMATSRKTNVDMIKKLERTLGRNNTGFIVYFSDKNHFMNTIKTENNGRSSKILTGFSSGTAMSLKNFEPVLSKANGLKSGVSASLIVQSIMQTLKGINGHPGAIGETYREEIRSWLATLFAYFLFDDVGNIGISTKGSTLTSLHVMNLNGVYIPLSVIFDRFAAALESSMA